MPPRPVGYYILWLLGSETHWGFWKIRGRGVFCARVRFGRVCVIHACVFHARVFLPLHLTSPGQRGGREILLDILVSPIDRDTIKYLESQCQTSKNKPGSDSPKSKANNPRGENSN